MSTPAPRTRAVNPDPNLAHDRRTDAEAVSAALQACAFIGRARRVICDGQLCSAHFGLESGPLGGVVLQLIDEPHAPAPRPQGLPTVSVWVDTGLVIWRFTLHATEPLGPGRWRFARPDAVESEG
jgi:hypothetical protein